MLASSCRPSAGLFQRFLNKRIKVQTDDERDVIRVRTNYRHEELYLCRTSVKDFLPLRKNDLF